MLFVGKLRKALGFEKKLFNFLPFGESDSGKMFKFITCCIVMLLLPLLALTLLTAVLINIIL